MADQGVRKYCTTEPGHSNHYTCNFCGFTMRGGGITRVKLHLSGNDSARSVRKCDKCPPEVKKEMRLRLQEVQERKKSKRTIETAIRSEMRKKLSPLDRDFKDPEMERQMYRAMKNARVDVAASEWISSGPGSGSDFGSRPELGRAASFGVARSAAASTLDLTDITLQKLLPEMSDSSAKKRLGRAISQFFIHENIPASLVTSRHFINMIATAAEMGPGVPIPSVYEIHNTYLAMEVEETKAYVDKQRQVWNEFGCTIMVDGWTGPTKLSMINVLVYSSGKTVFLKSINASGQIENHQFIFNVLNEVVKDVGAHNVVQVVTDNGSAYKKAGKQLMMKYNLYWTPCAAHCMDSMLEDVGKHSIVAQVIKDAQNITKLIYNDEILLTKMIEHGKCEIVCRGPTRFATNYLMLASLRNNKSVLRTMFSSEWWGDYSFCHTVAGGIVESKVMHSGFWDLVDDVCEIFEPIYNALRLVDTEVIPTLGLLDHVFETMKDMLEKLQGKQWVMDIANNMWKNQLCQPLHQAAHYLNPKFQYNPDVMMKGEHLLDVFTVFETLYPHDDCSEIGIEVIKFRDAKGIFGSKSATGGRLKMPAVEWWNVFGHETPALQKLAKRVLSQTASSSACGRNWSTLALIHTKKMNRLAHKRLKQLVFCSYNMKLRTRDEKAEDDNVEARDPLEIIQRSMETMREDTRDDVLLDWIRPAHLDDAAQNPDPAIAARAREEGVDVDRVVKEETGATSHDYHGLSDGNSAGDSYKLL